MSEESERLGELRERKALTRDEARPEAIESRRAAGGRTARENVADLVDEGSFVAVTKDAGYLNKGGKTLKKVGSVKLAPYAVARIAAV